MCLLLLATIYNYILLPYIITVLYNCAVLLHGTLCLPIIATMHNLITINASCYPPLQGVHRVFHFQGPPTGRARDGRVYFGGQRQDPGDQPLPAVQEQVRAPPHLSVPGEPFQY